jgi:hypothetical protein
LPGGADLGQLIYLIVVHSGNVMELAALKESTELLDVEAVRGHVGILGVPISQNLMHHEVRVSKIEDSLDANLLAEVQGEICTP